MEFIDHKNLDKNAIRNNSYVYIYAPTHPKSHHGRIYEHVYVVEKDLGRYLLEDEEVHHLDGSRDNNNISNLLVLSKRAHGRLHSWLNKVLPDMFKKTAISHRSEITRCKQCNSLITNGNNAFCDHNCRITYSNSNLGYQNNSSAGKLSKEDLTKLLTENSFLAVGKMYGVSDNAVRKWCKRLDIDYKQIVKDKRLSLYV